MVNSDVEARLAEIAEYATAGGGATLCEVDVPWLIAQVRSQMQRAEKAEAIIEANEHIPPEYVVQSMQALLDRAIEQANECKAETTTLREAVLRLWPRYEGDFTRCGLCGEGSYGMEIHPELHRPDCLVRAALAGKQGEPS